MTSNFAKGEQWDEVVRLFLVANTPTYLLKHLRQSEFVHALSREPIQELESELSPLVSMGQEQLKIEDLTKLYCLFVALALKNSNDAMQYISNLPSKDRWLDFMREAVLSGFMPTNTVSLGPSSALSLNLPQEIRIATGDSVAGQFSKGLNVEATSSPIG